MSNGYETYQDGNGEWRWRLKDGNGEIIADSGESYETQGGANRAISNVIEENLKAAEEGNDDSAA